MASSEFTSVLIGGQALLTRCAERLIERGHSVAAIVSDDPQIRDWIDARGIPRYAATADLPAEIAFDHLFSIANLKLLPAELLARAGREAINFHDGPLPERAGLNTPAWALLEGAREHGVSWHRMRAEVDRGDVLVERRFALDPAETAVSLNVRCFEAGLESFDELLEALERDDLTPRPLPPEPERMHRRRDRPAALGAIDPYGSVADAARIVRALDYGPTPNPLALAKLITTRGALPVAALEPRPGPPEGAAPGRVIGLGETADGLYIELAFGDGAARLRGVRTPDGGPLTLTAAAARGLAVGVELPQVDPAAARAATRLAERWAGAEPRWNARLAELRTFEPPYAGGARSARRAERRPELPADWTIGVDDPVATLLALHALLLLRLGDRLHPTPDDDPRGVDLHLVPAALDAALAPLGALAQLFAPALPLPLQGEPHEPFARFRERVAEQLTDAAAAGGFARDLWPRLHPGSAALPGAAALVRIVDPVMDETADGTVDDSSTGGSAGPGASVELEGLWAAPLEIVLEPGGRVRWRYDPVAFPEQGVARMQAQLGTLLRAALADPQRTLAELPILAPADLADYDALDATGTDYDRTLTVDAALRAQAERTPGRTALRSGGEALDYRTLQRRADALATRLQRAGVTPGDRVGIHLQRGPRTVVALLAALQAGAAYVPLDPGYPAERIRVMVEDGALALLLSEPAQRSALAGLEPPVLLYDDALGTALDAAPADAAPPPCSSPESLAYVIFTSGSTGRPKGVMVEHRNVIAFFAGMDAVLRPDTSAPDGPGTWLAVTSISFDISVLELLWTLARGFEVVLAPDAARAGASGPAFDPTGTDLSLFFFSSPDSSPSGSHQSADGEARADARYRLLLEAARFGDAHGFAAVWTPERHFHDFGGLFPNPAVVGAALAATTERIGIRAGSCVLPLHPPARIAEEWAVVDNLSGGRVGVSFASGWQPDDFVLRPEAFERRHALLEEGIEQVRALWRGEAVTFAGPDGEPRATRTYPRPLQPELPMWLTSAGNPATFAQAGRLGMNVLTHLLGQSLDELTEKIAHYRAAWRAAGHPGEGSVALMLHTFVGDSDEAVRAAVREPLRSYLRSSANLIRRNASSFPTYKGSAGGDVDASFENLDEDEMDALLDAAFDRYYRTSGLFGTPERCLDTVAQARAAGVDEIACLIDFGVPEAEVLAHLPQLAELQRLLGAPSDGAATPAASLPALIRAHQVTHLQATPSMASALLADPERFDDGSDALAHLHTVLIGGEAFPSELARELLAAAPDARLINMYGPTETTIWSSTHEVAAGDAPVPIGRPIANTRLRIVDRGQQPLPPTVPGELAILGDGVVRGYLGRSELTAERFVTIDAGRGERARAYRSGDLARLDPQGRIAYLGRIDHQVKVRGFRIELGEVEATLERHPAVAQAVVSARRDDGADPQLVAYVLAADPAAPPDPQALRDHVAATLPPYMVPALALLLDAFPLTPNKKVDRKALPDPARLLGSAAPRTGRAAPTPPSDALERDLLSVWVEVLGLEADALGTQDDFFAFGGDSIRAVHAVSRARALGHPVTLRDLFRTPTVAALAEGLRDADTAAPERPADDPGGSAPLTPGQHRYFVQRRPADPHHWNHTALVALRRPLEPAALERALATLMRRHDALRMRFETEPGGALRQRFLPAVHADRPGAVPLSVHDLRARTPAEAVREHERIVTELQGSLDLQHGPLFRVAQLRHPDRDETGASDERLWVAIHHLLLDPISWRVFWSDLEALLADPDATPPAASASFRTWSAALAEHAADPAVGAALEVLDALPWEGVRPLPLDFSVDRFEDNRNADYGILRLELSQEPVLRLLRARGGRPDVVVAAALATTLADWSNGSSVLLDVVGLLRGELIERADLDASRTFGYFVDYAPTVLTPPEGATEAATLAAIAAQLGAQQRAGARFDLLRYLGPDPAMGRRLDNHPRAEVVLNFRGRQELEPFLTADGPFAPSDGPRGPSHSPAGRRSHPFNVGVDTAEDAMIVTLTFGRALHRPDTVRAWADRLERAIVAFAEVAQGRRVRP